ncbi:hypothetical protein BAE44_0008416 [Dichanthelium oligosanthes]|uniref:NAD-dependent epimerase/dehydratase domain-containing protein n=1 Tax=Dichanthelium oligosanthes TaxID=888268 RepID=A0A1E5VZK6_9POAL|nr:hypothetical protein BAE44_0008416 [Dichanthelium oligosanthes]
MIPATAHKPAAPPVASAPQPRHMFVFGAGFVGRYVSERLLAQGWQVSGTCTSADKKRELEMLGMNASVFNATESDLENIHSLQQASHLLISIPPIPGIGDPLLNFNEDLRRILSHGNLEWLCYLSSTSKLSNISCTFCINYMKFSFKHVRVYGDCGGALVDEEHTVNPKSESAKLRYKAEKGWLSLVDDLNLSDFIFRLGGIYGPGRSKIFNVVDDDPAPRAEVFAFARSLIEMRYPDLIAESADVSPGESDSQERIMPAEKRVSNARLKKELGVKLLHPTYRSGLQSIIDSWPAESQLPDRNQ